MFKKKYDSLGRLRPLGNVAAGKRAVARDLGQRVRNLVEDRKNAKGRLAELDRQHTTDKSRVEEERRQLITEIKALDEAIADLSARQKVASGEYQTAQRVFDNAGRRAHELGLPVPPMSDADETDAEPTTQMPFDDGAISYEEMKKWTF